MNLRTDLAVESVYDHKDEGILEENENIDGVTVTRIEIVTEDAAKKVGKPMGHFTTLEGECITKKEPETIEKVSKILSDEIKKILPKNYGKILVVGLGNRNITPDALGPVVTDHLMVTNHIMQFLNTENEKDFSAVSAVSPGVMGITGIETGDIIKGIVSIHKPSLVIAVDALCAKSKDRMFNTIQITDTGIHPGAGVGNRRDGLNEKSLGVPVIAIGIPTVVDSNAIIFDALFQFFNKNDSIEDAKKIIDEILSQDSKILIVSPKDIDSLIERTSKMIANGINLALHKNIDLKFIENFVS